MASQGIGIVVPEPSCLAAFRDELPALLGDDPRARRFALLARSPAEHLLATGGVDRIIARASADPGPLVIHPHCHGRASRAAPADAELARRLGYEVTVLDAGCCGLAGSFGFRAEHEALSRRIGEETWLPAVHAALDRAGPGRAVAIDGFSCATQADLGHLPLLPLLTTVRRLLDHRPGS